MHAATHRFRRLFIAASLVVVASSGHTAGTTQEDAEYRIKAAFLYHFCNYVKWPDEVFTDKDSPLTVGVAGPAAVVERLRETVNGRLAHGRPISIHRVRRSDPLQNLHVLYVADQDAATFDVDAISTRPILVITESRDGLDVGGIINFIIENDRVRFDIAPETARERHLDISAQLLTVARHVRGTGD